MPFLFSLPKRKHSWISLVSLFLLVPLPLWAQVDPPQDCTTRLIEANELFISGSFSQAVDLIQTCAISGGFSSPAERVRAYEIMAYAFLATGRQEEARNVISDLLDADPAYAPDVDQSTMAYRNLVAEIQTRRQPPSTPIDIRATADSQAVTLNWSHEEENKIERYRIWRGGSTNALVVIDSVQTTSFTDRLLRRDIDYYYAIQAIGTNGVMSERTAVVRIRIETPEPVEITNVDSPTKNPSNRRWMFIGGGVLAGGVVAAILASGNGSNPPGGNGTQPGILIGPPQLP